MSRGLSFTPRRPRGWKGRYRRIPGKTTVLHVRRTGGRWWPFVDWRIGLDTAECMMVDQGDVEALVAAIHAGKRSLGSSDGGSFLVNEFGQVLVPATELETTRVAHVGDCDGPLRFQNSFDPGTTFDLTNTKVLKPGDPWEMPYVGLIYNVNEKNEVCFKKTDSAGAGYVYAPVQDQKLIGSLRALRPYGWVRIIVGAGGVVLTKIEPDWQAHYVGRVNPTMWFQKEG